MDLNATECAYLAAIIEGEGCIRIEHVAPAAGKPKSGWRPVVHITQKGKEWLEEIHKIFPGQLIVHRDKKHSGQFRLVWSWGKAYEVLEKTISHMKNPSKKKQAEVVLNFHKHILEYGGKGYLPPEELEWRLVQLKILSYLKKNAI